MYYTVGGNNISAYARIIKESFGRCKILEQYCIKTLY